MVKKTGKEKGYIYIEQNRHSISKHNTPPKVKK